MASLKNDFHKYVAQVTDFDLMQIEPERAEGIYIYDTQGKKYIDFISGICVNNLGHRHPAVIDAIEKQLKKYLHIMVYGEYVQSPQIKLAKAFAENLPPSLNCTFFVNSGSEAIEGAMKLAKLVNHRSEIVAFKNSYHGSTLGAVSLYSDEQFKNPFRPLLPDVRFLTYNDVNELKNITTKTCCLVAEPIQAGAGMKIPTTEFMQALRNRCTETGTLLILDEIQSGFGRTGKLFAFEHYEIVPDVICVAKGMGGGMPLGAFIASRELMNYLDNGHPLIGHATTFGGHPVSCAAALASLQFITENRLFDLVDEKVKLFTSLLTSKKIKGIRGLGFMMAVELESAENVEKVVSRCIENGLIINWFLFNNTSLNIAPPLIISNGEITEAAKILNNCINQL